MTAKSCPVCSIIDEHPAHGFWYVCTDCGTKFRPATVVDTETYPRPYRAVVRERNDLLAACARLRALHNRLRGCTCEICAACDAADLVIAKAKGEQ